MAHRLYADDDAQCPRYDGTTLGHKPKDSIFPVSASPRD